MSKTDGRVGNTTNVIIGGTVADDSAKDWLVLDQQVSLIEKTCVLEFGHSLLEMLFLSLLFKELI